jgi:alkylation response protein AidB-like acyl-CoA dehydrogenase
MLNEDVVRGELARLLPAAGQPAPWDDLDELEAGRAYLRLLFDGGWVIPSWPEHVGGLGASAAEAAMVERVRADFATPDLYPFSVGLAIAGPVLLKHGTPDQQTRWCPAIAQGHEVWAQMFSEPSAGSDLAGVTTRAVPAGEGWSLTGQKVWTSRAHYAQLGFCLARTDPAVPKHQGLTMFALPMDQPGVTVRPLTQMNGDTHFNEVFLDDARADPGQLIDLPGAGWKVAVTALSFERTTTLHRDVTTDPLVVPSWLTEQHERGVLDDPMAADAALRAYVAIAAASIADLRAADVRAASGPGAEGSGGKLRHVAAYKALAGAVHRAAGLDGLLAEGEAAHALLTAPSWSIRGGTDEIQRNIVGERVLKLPKDPFKDTDIPFNQRMGSEDPQ